MANYKFDSFDTAFGEVEIFINGKTSTTTITSRITGISDLVYDFTNPTEYRKQSFTLSIVYDSSFITNKSDIYNGVFIIEIDSVAYLKANVDKQSISVDHKKRLVTMRILDVGINDIDFEPTIDPIGTDSLEHAYLTHEYLDDYANSTYGTTTTNYDVFEPYVISSRSVSITDQGSNLNQLIQNSGNAGNSNNLLNFLKYTFIQFVIYDGEATFFTLGNDNLSTITLTNSDIMSFKEKPYRESEYTYKSIDYMYNGEGSYYDFKNIDSVTLPSSSSDIINSDQFHLNSYKSDSTVLWTKTNTLFSSGAGGTNYNLYKIDKKVYNDTVSVEIPSAYLDENNFDQVKVKFWAKTNDIDGVLKVYIANEVSDVKLDVNGKVQQIELDISISQSIDTVKFEIGSDIFNNFSADIESITKTGGFITVNTIQSHGITATDSIDIDGTTNYNGTHTVLDAPTNKQFRITSAGSLATENSGKVYTNEIEKYFAIGNLYISEFDSTKTNAIQETPVLYSSNPERYVGFSTITTLPNTLIALNHVVELWKQILKDSITNLDSVFKDKLGIVYVATKNLSVKPYTIVTINSIDYIIIKYGMDLKKGVINLEMVEK